MLKPLLKPLKDLKGKLRFLHLDRSFVMRTVYLANSIKPSKQASTSALDYYTEYSILALKSYTPPVTKREYYQFLFDYQVHNEAALFNLPSTIFDDLSPSYKKVSCVISNLTSKLTTRQLLYLNYSLRDQINKIILPNWDNLHLHMNSPSKPDFYLLPTLNKICHNYEVRTAGKKTVMGHMIEAKKNAAK